MQEILMSGGAAVLAGAVLGLLIASLMMQFSAKLAGVQSPTLGASAGSILVGGFVNFMCTLVCSIVPVLGTIIGFFAGLLLQSMVTASIFRSTFGKGFLTCILYMFFGALIVAALFMGGVGAVTAGVADLIHSAPHAAFTYAG